MADSTMFAKSADVGKLKVVELKKELKSRGLSTSGDKSELVARLQSVLNKDSITEDTLDSDEIDSEGVLEDDDDDEDGKAVDDLIGDLNESEVTASSAIGTSVINELPDSVSGNTLPAVPFTTTTRTLKRRAPPPGTDKLPEPEPTPSKKIVLNRTAITAPTKEPQAEPLTPKLSTDPRARLEMRAKRFGLPLSEDSAKEARKARFGAAPTGPVQSAAVGATLDILKKRAERFGTSVSKLMVDAENQEKLEKRKAKFGMIKT